jgi:hypothetical protein
MGQGRFEPDRPMPQSDLLFDDCGTLRVSNVWYAFFSFPPDFSVVKQVQRFQGLLLFLVTGNQRSLYLRSSLVNLCNILYFPATVLHSLLRSPVNPCAFLTYSSRLLQDTNPRGESCD